MKRTTHRRLAMTACATAALALGGATLAGGDQHSARTALRPAGAHTGFQFGHDVAVSISSIGTIRFRCTPGRMFVASFRHLGTQQTTVDATGSPRVRFHHGAVFTAPPQHAGTQVWRTRFADEAATETATITLEFATTAVTRGCYVKHSVIRTTYRPHSR